MAHVIQFRYGKKLHLVGRLMSDSHTLCGKKIPPNSKIHSKYPEGNMKFCKGCHEFVGANMMADFLGWDFFESHSSEGKTNGS